ncbi:regulatory protein RecX [Paractinoplanes maris]|uniref:regulatory protein RecX n=1 Tax=Paractinoplanes maris TaxID=1734446 RepID=UPI0020216F89|nr:regulatory protein RecX [Actinoplanes maris]
MPARRGARSGRGWDPLPPRPARAHDEQPLDELPAGDDPERGNVPTRRRRDSPGGTPSPDDGAGRRGRAAGGAAAQPAQSESDRAREICLRQLAVRPRTRAELAKVLVRKEISEEVIAEVLDRYDEVGIIDDAAFARAWVASRHHGRGLARRALANELRQRGVDAEVAGEALETVDDDDEAATARALVDRKLRTASGAPDAVFRRLVGMLARKGYPAGVAIRAVKDALAARDAEAAEFADQLDADALASDIDPTS